jgi:rhamnosyltransferase
MTAPTVAVLISTYNGERFLEQQLTSLYAQTYPRLHILVRDDGSTDGTCRILDEHAELGRLTVLQDSAGNIGPARSFMALLNASSADLHMFCDQDDVWGPEKVANAVAALERGDPSVPRLLHTDLEVVGPQLEPIAKSFMSNEGLRLPSAHGLGRLLVQNCAVGCTVAINEPLRLLALEGGSIHQPIAMHDWWLALVACCFGEIRYSPTRSIRYRQHSANASGVRRGGGWLAKVAAQLSRNGVDRVERYQSRIAAQARAFLEAHGARLRVRDRVRVTLVSALDGRVRALAWPACLATGIRFQNAHMNIAFFSNSILGPLIKAVQSGGHR